MVRVADPPERKYSSGIGGFMGRCCAPCSTEELGTDLPPLPAIHPQRVVRSDTVECDLDQLEEIGCLGRGAFGSVNLGRCGVIGQVLALREMSKGMLALLQLQQSLKIEEEAIQASSIPFIVKLAATFSREQTVYLLLEAAMGGDLYTVYRRQRLCGSEVRARFYTVCDAFVVQHLHSKLILYCDSKRENIVIDGRGYCKLCDLAQPPSPPATPTSCTGRRNSCLRRSLQAPATTRQLIGGRSGVAYRRDSHPAPARGVPPEAEPRGRQILVMKSPAAESVTRLWPRSSW